jgi:2-(1,2-epoxy-1,2-dihydrophenyl)acetyl-CoA isomerase
VTDATWQPWRPEGDPFETLVLERSGEMGRITFNNPDRLNSLTRLAFAEVARAVTAANEDDEVGVLILTGAGRGFCSGADVQDFLARRTPAEVGGIPDKAGRELPLLEHAEIPIVAAVNGPAAGAGCILALLADIRIASTEAFFVESHVARGLTPSVGAWLLPRMVGLTKATEMVLLGRRVYAAEARDIGLVSEVVEPDQLLKVAESYASELLALPRFAMLTARGALRRSLHEPLANVREWAGAMEALSLATTDEAAAGTAGFSGSSS